MSNERCAVCNKVLHPVFDEVLLDIGIIMHSKLEMYYCPQCRTFLDEIDENRRISFQDSQMEKNHFFVVKQLKQVI
ncbi:MAG: hypothetical protein BAJALOKI1v1_1070012 [Promethearchaeota archaeon]|nr:MAG: hypothetical protein BAJALOKI1v1_1070012 [Candidatus Lokiarchaeota archaeon]